ncbi:hypothetical protein JGF37_12370 [Salmonella enterica subsp. enterica serovar Goldcoast]|nr:hypothetical protein [Salmonella enterica subsp. enterica serovar Goldcoast]
MHRIDTPTAQKDKFGAGKNGFTRGNPQTGTPATGLDDDYFDMLQEELAGVVEATGVNLEKSKHNQLLTALKVLLLSRAHPFADIKADGPAAIAEALSNLGLHETGFATLTSSGNFTVPPGVTELWISGCAGGAGGGGSQTTSNVTVAGSGGGSSGGFVQRFKLAVTPGQVIPYTIGAAGTGGAAGGGIGGDGGNTTFGSYLTLLGGKGGAVGQTSSGSASGGIGGLGGPAGSGGGHGSWGGDSQDTNGGGAYGGKGGDCPFGAAGGQVRGNVNPIAGMDAVGYGAGGSGAGGANGNGAHTGAKGGNGAPGVLFIEW